MTLLVQPPEPNLPTRCVPGHDSRQAQLSLHMAPYLDKLVGIPWFLKEQAPGAWLRSSSPPHRTPGKWGPIDEGMGHDQYPGIPYSPRSLVPLGQGHVLTSNLGPGTFCVCIPLQKFRYIAKSLAQGFRPI